MKEKTVKYEINEKQEPILKFCSGKSTKYVLNDETLDKFNDIISKKNNRGIDVTPSKTMTAELEMKSNMKLLTDNNDELNAKLDKELSELKQMITKLITKTDGSDKS